MCRRVKHRRYCGSSRRTARSSAAANWRTSVLAVGVPLGDGSSTASSTTCDATHQLALGHALRPDAGSPPSRLPQPRTALTHPDDHRSGIVGLPGCANHRSDLTVHPGFAANSVLFGHSNRQGDVAMLGRAVGHTAVCRMAATSRVEDVVLPGSYLEQPPRRRTPLLLPPNQKSSPALRHQPLHTNLSHTPKTHPTHSSAIQFP